jgi:hypothetical protein
MDRDTAFESSGKVPIFMLRPLNRYILYPPHYGDGNIIPCRFHDLS